MTWAFTIACGGREQWVRVEAARCWLEEDRGCYVFRDGRGVWVAEVAAGAVIEGPKVVADAVICSCEQSDGISTEPGFAGQN